MELALLKLKVFMQRLWTYTKLYWKELVFAVVLVYLFMFVKQKMDIIKALLADRDSVRKKHQENIDQLNQAVETETAARRKLESDYQTLIAQINQEHSDEIKRIAVVRSEEIKALIKKHQNNPVVMAQTINSLFGIPVMLTAETKQSWEPQE
jgi:hypothetical protein